MQILKIGRLINLHNVYIERLSSGEKFTDEVLMILPLPSGHYTGGLINGVINYPPAHLYRCERVPVSSADPANKAIAHYRELLENIYIYIYIYIYNIYIYIYIYIYICMYICIQEESFNYGLAM